jgi:hypothetical protein
MDGSWLVDLSPAHIVRRAFMLGLAVSFTYRLIHQMESTWVNLHAFFPGA